MMIQRRDEDPKVDKDRKSLIPDSAFHVELMRSKGYEPRHGQQTGQSKTRKPGDGNERAREKKKALELLS